MTDVLYRPVQGREIVFRAVIPQEAEEFKETFGPLQVTLYGDLEKGDRHIPVRYWIGKTDVFVPMIVAKAKPKAKAAKKAVEAVPKAGVAPAGVIEFYSGDLRTPEYRNSGVHREAALRNALLYEG